MENEIKSKLVSRVFVIAVALTMMLPISAVLAEAPGTNVVLLDLGDDAIPANMDVLVNYGNGKVLVEVTEPQLKGMQTSGLNAYEIDRTINPGVADISFDINNKEPIIAKNLMAPKNSDAYVVKFVGPVQTEWVDDVRSLGADVYRDVARYGILVRMDARTKTAVDNLNTVAWIGDYHPAYKISPDIWDDTGNVMISSIVFDDVFAVASELDKLGATINQIVPSDNMISFTIHESMIPQVAALPGIMEMYKDAPLVSQDTLITEVHGALDAWYPSWSGLSQPLEGSGEVIGMQDSGLSLGGAGNAGHTDFFQGPDGDRVIRYTDRTGNSDPDGNQDGVAHGTAVAGIAMGNGWAWETWAGENNNDFVWHKSETAGVAPRADISADGVVANGGGILANPAYWNTQYNDGARTMTNSYGATNPGNYGSYSTTVDNQMNGDTRMILFSAGNGGPLQDTLSPGAQAKNGLTVAAGQNYRPEWFSSDNPNIMADFSSRGGTFSNGRIKPDIAVVGTSGLTTLGIGEINYWGVDLQPSWYGPPPDEYNGGGGPGADGNADYTYFSGTSQSSPAAAGIYVLLREWLREVEGIAAPPSELTKAIMLNGADKMDENLYTYPGYDQGWGRPNVKKSIFPNPPTTVQYDYQTFTNNNPWTPAMTTTIASSDVPLRVTLVWKDVSGIALSRDIDLQLTSPGGLTYRGNTFTSSAPYWSVDTTVSFNANRPDAGPDGFDEDNNVEMVWIDAPEVGTWTIQVLVDNRPSNIPAAIVMSADIGPQSNYDVLLETDYPTTFYVVANGQANFQFKVGNYGSMADSILMSDDSPFTITYSPVAPFALNSGEKIPVVATVSAGAIGIGVYDFRLTGTSIGDPTEFSNLFLSVEVIAEPIPTSKLVADTSLDEVDPSVVTYTDQFSVSHIVVSYVKTTLNGKRIYVKHTTLDAQGEPILPWGPEVEPPDAGGSVYETPNDPRIYVMGAGTYRDRVFVVWTGSKVGASTTDYSTSWITYADTTSNFDAPADFQTREIDQNTGNYAMNVKRVNSLVPLASGNQIMYIWEHLDYVSDIAPNPSGVDTTSRISSNGGNTWGAATSVTPGDGNYYFFPNAVNSYDLSTNRDVAWIWFYWRTQTGNDRDLRVRLYDPVAGWQAGTTDVWNTADNIQFPAPIARNNGPNYRQYVTVVRDQGTSSYTLWSTYIDGNFNAGNPPTNSANGWGNTRGPFADATKISDANYNRRPILTMAATGDGYDWIAYMESANAYNIPNMETLYTNDGFNTQTNYRITLDSFAKGHQMLSSLTIGAYDNIYMVYHSSHGTVLEVDYNVYIVRFFQGWESVPDTVGPTVSSVIANPNPINATVTTTIDISANIDEVQTGFNLIAGAEYWINTAFNTTGTPVWTSISNMAISGGGSPTQTETASATDSIPSGYSHGNWFTVWVRGLDDQGNWGTGDYTTVDIIYPIIGTADLITFANPGGPWPAWRFISFAKGITGDVTQVLDDSLLGDGGTTWDMVQWYDPTDPNGDYWKTYVSGAAASDLPSLNNQMGLWVRITANGGDGILTTGLTGPDASGGNISLAAGWNLVGYPSNTPRTGTTTLPPEVTKMAVYSTGGYNIAEVPLSTVMSADNAYWVFATGVAVWNVGA